MVSFQKFNRNIKKMKRPGPPSPILILPFALWAVLMTFNIFGAHCLNEKFDASSRLKTCTWALKISFGKYYKDDYTDYVRIELERVIKLAENGRSEEGAEALDQLLHWAFVEKTRRGNTRYERKNYISVIIFSRLKKLEPESEAYIMASKVLGSFEEKSNED